MTDVSTAIARWVAEYSRDDARLTPAQRRARDECKRLWMVAQRAQQEAHDDSARRRRGRGKSRRNLELLERLGPIVESIQPASVRAVGYQSFTRGLQPDMSKASMNRLSTLLTYAREAGRMPWEWIVDETREPERVNAWADPSAYIATVRRSYRRDRWTSQAGRLEVWSEKGTIRGTLRPVLDAYGTTFRVMHGYASATALHDAAQDSVHSEKPLTVLYVGDWDPSGLHMSEIDLPRRLTAYGGDLTLIRLALTEADTRSGLPSFATESKRRDARFRWYADRYGPRCWELDALSPVVLRDRLEQAIVARLDIEAWRQADAAERAECESLAAILQTWPGVAVTEAISGPAPKCFQVNGDKP